MVKITDQRSRSEDKNVPFFDYECTLWRDILWLLVEFFVQKWPVRPRVIIF